MTRVARRGVSTAALVVLLALALAGTAAASWGASGTGTASVGATSVNRPPAPLATVTSTGIGLSWTATTLGNGAAVNSYTVRRYSGGGSGTLVCSTTSTSCVDSTATAGSWTYGVTAHFAANWSSQESPRSDAVVASAPSAPALQVSASGTSLVLSWSDVSADAYHVERYDHGTETWNRIQSSLSGTTLTYTDALACGQTRSYRVVAVNHYGETASNEKSGTTGACAITTAPTLTATANGTSIDLSWTSVAGAEQYKVERLTGGNWGLIATVTGTSHSDAIGCGTTGTYRVRGVNAAGDGPNSVEKSATTIVCVPSLAPTLSTSVTANTVNLSWTSVVGATSYEVEYLAGSNWTPLTTTSSTSHADPLACGQTRKYRVRGTNIAGDGPDSNEATASTPACPKATSVTLANSGGSSNAGRVNSGDTVSVAYSAALNVASVCSTWSGNNPALTGDNDVTVTITNSGGNDVLTVASATCAVKFGSVALGGDYVSATATFGGSGNSNRSEISYSTSQTRLTVKMGALKTGTLSSSAAAAATTSYTADAAMADAAGNAMDTSPVTSGNQRL